MLLLILLWERMQNQPLTSYLIFSKFHSGKYQISSTLLKNRVEEILCFVIWSKVWNTNQQKSSSQSSESASYFTWSQHAITARRAAAEAATNISSVTIIGTQHFTIIYFGDGRKIETKESKPFLSSYD